MSMRRLPPLRLRTTLIAFEGPAGQVNIIVPNFLGGLDSAAAIYTAKCGGLSFERLGREEFMNRRHALRAALAVSIAGSLPRASAQEKPVAIKLALNRAPYDASNAPFLLARDKGYFAREGLDVTMSLSKNATDAIRRVTLNEFDFGFIDGSVSMRAAMQSGAPSPVYLFAIFDRSPACIVT